MKSKSLDHEQISIFDIEPAPRAAAADPEKERRNRLAAELYNRYYGKADKKSGGAA